MDFTVLFKNLKKCKEQKTDVILKVSVCLQVGVYVLRKSVLILV